MWPAKDVVCRSEEQVESVWAVVQILGQSSVLVVNRYRPVTNSVIGVDAQRGLASSLF